MLRLLNRRSTVKSRAFVRNWPLSMHAPIKFEMRYSLLNFRHAYPEGPKDPV